MENKVRDLNSNANKPVVNKPTAALSTGGNTSSAKPAMAAANTKPAPNVPNTKSTAPAKPKNPNAKKKKNAKTKNGTSKHKRAKEVNGIKLNKRFSLISFLSGVLCALLVAVLVFYCIKPIMSLTSSSEASIDVTVLDLARNGLSSLGINLGIESENCTKFFEALNGGLSSDNLVLSWFPDFYGYILTGILGSFVLIAICGFFEFLFAFRFLFTGTAKHFKRCKNIAISMTIWSVLLLLCLFAVNFCYGELLLTNDSSLSMSNMNWAYICFGATFGSALFLSWIYPLFFKNRLFVKKARKIIK